MEAIATDDLQELKRQVEAGLDPNSDCEDNLNLLCFCVLQKNVPALEYLISKGGDVNKLNPVKYLPINYLYRGYQTKRHEILKVLLDAGFRLDKLGELGYDTLYDSIVSNNINLFKLLLDSGVDINLKKSTRWSHIFSIIQSVKWRDSDIGYEIFNIALNKGLDINECTNDGNSPLYYTIEIGSKTGDLYMAYELLKRNAILKCNHITKNITICMIETTFANHTFMSHNIMEACITFLIDTFSSTPELKEKLKDPIFQQQIETIGVKHLFTNYKLE